MASELERLARKVGADDAGWIPIDHPDLGEEREEILARFPWCKSLLAFVKRMNREPIRSPMRSLANVEFHGTGHAVDQIGHEIVSSLERQGVRALNVTMGFPMEMDEFPGRIWAVSHKPVAQAAGLGRMGIHRNLIHPRFGSFILLGTVLLDHELTPDQARGPIDFDPCLECKLCVAACPTGALSPEGELDFSACVTHNYREFLGGFSNWTESVVESKDAKGYRKRVSDAETASWWQSLAFGPNYKAAYCLAVCPAGEDVIAPWKENKSAFKQTVLKPLVDKQEQIYVLPGSDAEAWVHKRFPNKTTRLVGNGIRPRTLAGFIRGLSLTFQRGAAKTLDATYAFHFTGAEQGRYVIRISKGRLEVREGTTETGDLRMRADLETWLGFLARERSLVWALLRRRIRLRGDPRLLLAFGRCFPLA